MSDLKQDQFDLLVIKKKKMLSIGQEIKVDIN